MESQEEVLIFFKSKGLLLESITSNESTSSAEDAAAVINCDTGEIAKSIVLNCDGEAVLVLIEGTKRVDLKKVENVIKRKAKIASAEFITEKTGFVAGGVAPINRNVAAVIIDSGVMKHSYVWVSSGSRNSVMKIRTDLLPDALSAGVYSVSLEK